MWFLLVDMNIRRTSLSFTNEEPFHDGNNQRYRDVFRDKTITSDHDHGCIDSGLGDFMTYGTPLAPNLLGKMLGPYMTCGES